jgi:hypothetical protein
MIGKVTSGLAENEKKKKKSEMKREKRPKGRERGCVMLYSGENKQIKSARCVAGDPARPLSQGEAAGRMSAAVPAADRRLTVACCGGTGQPWTTWSAHARA